MNRDEAIALLKGGKDGVQTWNQWRLEHGTAQLPWLTGADLSKADLGGAKLDGAHLHQAKLGGANLDGANLRVAYLGGADLTGANLSKTYLVGAYVFEADLRGANLTRADLSMTYLSKSNLDGANFDRARAGMTSFENLDLSNVVGLETIQHRGPSTIGVDTLFKSRGKIPEVFLRGCGVPEPLIKNIPTLIASVGPADYFSCFISYSHTDQRFARRLYDQLQGRGIRCWLDGHEILPGDDIYQKVDQGLRLWDKVLLCCSTDSLTSGWVEREIDTAIEREMRLRKERDEQVLCVIPLNLDGHLFEWNGSHAATLRKRLAADFTGWESDDRKFEEQFERVVKALRSDEAARPGPPEPKL